MPSTMVSVKWMVCLDGGYPGEDLTVPQGVDHDDNLFTFMEDAAQAALSLKRQDPDSLVTIVLVADE